MRVPDIPPLVHGVMRRYRVDFEPSHQQPTPPSLLVATAVAIVGALVADAALVAFGESVFPWTRGYQHYQFGDYSKLTVVGVIIACVAWPIVTRITSHPRWVFFRMAIVVSAVLLLPDVAILARGDSAAAVLVLVLMHVAIAVVTYQALTRLAPERAGAHRATAARR